jgi:uncharacterized membrane protein
MVQAPRAISEVLDVRISAMNSRPEVLLAASHARDAAYDIVLLAHVLSALIAFGAIAVAGAYALALRGKGASTESVRRYYRPGVNWAGRVLFLVPVLGVALIAMSKGDWSFSDGWIAVGLMLWVVAALVAEMALWPIERKLQRAVDGLEGGAPDGAIGRECLQVAGMAFGLLVILVVATVVMVAKP